MTSSDGIFGQTQFKVNNALLKNEILSHFQTFFGKNLPFIIESTLQNVCPNSNSDLYKFSGCEIAEGLLLSERWTMDGKLIQIPTNEMFKIDIESDPCL